MPGQVLGGDELPVEGRHGHVGEDGAPGGDGLPVGETYGDRPPVADDDTLDVPPAPHHSPA
ncbi:hypothetical protein RKD47_006039 [Streptomyces albogriseolus]